MDTATRRIAIIGGGFTGLTCAYRLSQEGHKVTILERASELGGLASGFRIQGTSLEKTYHHLFRSDTDIIRLMEELGIGGRLMWRESSIAIYYGGVLYPFSTPFDLLRFKPLSFSNRIRAGLVALYLQKTKNWKKFVPVSAYAWMKKWSGEQVLRVIWEPLLRGKFHVYFDRVSMAWLWVRLYVRGNSKISSTGKEVLGYIDGGFAVLVEELVGRLRAKGTEIITGVSVQEITPVNDKAAVTYALGEKKVTQEFDQVVATTPSGVFGKLVEKSAPPEYLRMLGSIDYLGAVCLVFSSEQELSRYYWHNINDLSLPFLVFVQHTKLVGSSSYRGKQVYYIGSYVPHDHEYFSMSDSALSERWFSALKKIFPAFDETLIADKFVFKFKNAQHIVDVHYESKIPPYETPLDGVYLANFSQIFPEDRGTNYAVREGNKIAEILLSHPAT